MKLAFLTVAAAVCSANALAQHAVDVEALLTHLLKPNLTPDGDPQAAAPNATAARELQSCSYFSDCYNCASQASCKWCSWSSSSSICQSTSTSCSSGFTSVLFPSSCPSSGYVGCSGYGGCSTCNSQGGACVWCQYDYGSGGFCRQASASYCSGSYTSVYSSSSCSSSGGSSSDISFNGASISGLSTASKPPAVPAGGTFAIALIFTLAVVGVTTWQVSMAMAAGAAAAAASANAGPAVMMSNPLAKQGAGGTVVVATGGGTTTTATIMGVRSLGWTGFKNSSATNITVRRLIYTGAAALSFLNMVYFLVASLAVWYTATFASVATYYLSLHTAVACGAVGGTTICAGGSIGDGALIFGLLALFLAAFFNIMLGAAFTALAINAARVTTNGPACCCPCYRAPHIPFPFAVTAALLGFLGMVIPGARYGSLFGPTSSVFAASSAIGMGSMAVVIAILLCVASFMLWKVMPSKVPVIPGMALQGGTTTTVVMMPGMGMGAMGMGPMGYGNPMAVSAGGGTTVVMAPSQPAMVQPIVASPYPQLPMASPYPQQGPEVHAPLAVQKVVESTHTSFEPQGTGGGTSYTTTTTTTTSSSSDYGLPAGWEAKLDPSSNAWYYVNGMTGASQWEVPTTPAA